MATRSPPLNPPRRGIESVRLPDGGVGIDVPLRTRRRANGSHGHFMEVTKRVEAQHVVLAAALRLQGGVRPVLPCGLVVTRYVAGKQDRHDNLPITVKAIVDAFATWAGFDDGDDKFFVAYRQVRIGPRDDPRIRLVWYEDVEACVCCDNKGWSVRDPRDQEPEVAGEA